MHFPDPTATEGMSRVTFDPFFDRLPSNGALVNTESLARQYIKELYDPTAMGKFFDRLAAAK